MRYLSIALLALGIGGCSFSEGFKDALLRQLPGVAAEAVDAKLGDDFKELGGAIRDFGTKIPPPTSPVDNGLGYTLGGLVAYILGSAGKGMLRATLGEGRSRNA